MSDKNATRPMMPLEQIAIEALRCALSWEPHTCLIGNVMASEIAALAASRITSCPECGVEPWVNIDCDLCLVCSTLGKERGNE